MGQIDRSRRRGDVREARHTESAPAALDKSPLMDGRLETPSRGVAAYSLSALATASSIAPPCSPMAMIRPSGPMRTTEDCLSAP
jgi:hypothetical protein